MNSSYRPGRRDDGRDRYGHRGAPPPPSRRQPEPPSRRDLHTEPQDRASGQANGHVSRGYAVHSQQQRREPQPDSPFVFRGAASESGPGPGRGKERFTFEPAAGPPPTRFPSAHEQPLPPRPVRRDNGRPPRRDGQRPQKARAGEASRGRRFGPRPAHARDILTRGNREVTPEQLPGMNSNAAPKFRETAEDEFFSGSDDTNEESDKDGGNSRTKRRKLQLSPEREQPKWSNPDPYTALPPPSQTNGPKKDIVETIRKAKIDQVRKQAGSNPVEAGVDFISFEDGDGSDASSALSADEAASTMINAALGPPNGRKRGFHEISSDGVLGGEITDDWVPDHTNPTPWLPGDDVFTSNVGLKLHKEIVNFYDFVRPLDYENVVRQDIAGRIEKAIQGWYHGRGVQVYCFGSFPAGLYLPSADMDLVALSPRYMKDATPTFCLSMPDKRKLRSILRSAGVFDPIKGADIIGFAKVPLIKFSDLQTGLKVDISFENHSGLEAQTTLQKWKGQFPDMPVLVALIKQFLAMRNLNEVFRGGIGGFTIICLVVSMLQHMPEYQSNNMDPHTRYGDLLLNFFDLYGNKFNYRRTGIIMEPASYFDKDRERHRVNVRYQDDRLTIVDPNRPDNDISGGSRLIEEVFTCFRGAHALLQRRLSDVRKGMLNTRSILECILGGNYTSYIETRAKLHRVYLRNYPGGEGSRNPGNPSEIVRVSPRQLEHLQQAADNSTSKAEGISIRATKTGESQAPNADENSRRQKLERRRAKKQRKKEAARQKREAKATKSFEEKEARVQGKVRNAEGSAKEGANTNAKAGASSRSLRRAQKRRMKEAAGQKSGTNPTTEVEEKAVKAPEGTENSTSRRSFPLKQKQDDPLAIHQPTAVGANARSTALTGAEGNGSNRKERRKRAK